MEPSVDFQKLFERFVMGAIIVFLLLFAVTAALGTPPARSVLAFYSFFMMGVYLFRGYYFKLPYDKIEIAGCFIIGVALKSLNHLAL